MERFVVEVEKSKAKFFTDLINSFDFAEVINVDNIVEPRIYPAADFEIRPGNKTSKTSVKNKHRTSDVNSSHNSDIPSDDVNESQKNLKQIRDAMSVIDRKREEYRK